MLLQTTQNILLLFQGGYDAKSRAYSAKQTAERSADIDGFLIDALHSNGPESRDLDLAQAIEVIREVTKVIPEDKPRLYQGSVDPLMVLELVEAGIDLFESTYAYQVGWLI